MPTIGTDRTAAPLRMPWREGIAVGRGYELLRADLLDHLETAQAAIGYRSCRFHAIFHDDVDVVSRRADGGLSFHWHQLDKVYDALLARGLRPFVELNPMPKALASGDQPMFWYGMNVTPPADVGEWERLVEAFATHCIERWGSHEVRQWHFEVWNEPNLAGFWGGDQEAYFQLYAASARALKRVDPQLRVGGPASSKAAWLSDLIDWCADNEVPLDFVSSHLYTQDEYVEHPDRVGSPYAVGDYFVERVRAAVAEVRASRMPHLPVHWTEWNSLATDASDAVDWSDNPSVDRCYAGAFAARVAIELDDALDTLCWWVASDIFEEGGPQHAPFSCTYGLLTVHGLPKASFNAFALAARLRGPRQPVSGLAAAPAGCGLAATREGPCLHVLAYHHCPLEERGRDPWRDELELELPSGDYLCTRARVGPGAGSAYETWDAMGRPLDLSRAQLELLRAHSVPAHDVVRVQARGDRLRLPLELAADEVLYLELRPCAEPARTKAERRSAIAQWNAEMGAQSQ